MMSDCKPKIRLALIENRGSVADSYSAVLELAPDIDFVGSAPDGPGGLALIERESPDVVLVDLRLEGSPFNGDEVIRRARARGWTSRLLVITEFVDHPLAGEALAAGADGLLSRSPRFETLLNAIRLVHKDIFVLGPMNELGDWYGGIDVRTQREPCPLTARQMDVLELIAQGFTNDEISVRLVLAEGTVRSHVSNILEILGVSGRQQAADMATENGWIG